MTTPGQALNAYKRFDLSDITTSRVGISCETPCEAEPGGTIHTTRFARVDKLEVDDRGLCLRVTYDDGETEVVHMSRVTYVDGKHVLP